MQRRSATRPVPHTVESDLEARLTKHDTTPKRAGIWENLGTSHVDLEPIRLNNLGRRNTTRANGRGRLGQRNHLLAACTTALILLLGLISLQLLAAFSTLRLPRLLTSPYLHALLGALVFFFVVRTYTEATHSLAFTSRFIRPGLRRLVEDHEEHLSRGEKLFRGRRATVMKVDMADFTATTFDMPYGMRRLFVDLWFTLIDQVVAEHVFLDKSLGDGSVYYFGGEADEARCSEAVAAALTIRSRQVELFDVTFARLLCAKLAESEELTEAVSSYMERYRARVGSSFWDRRTRIRIALVTGYVDEGLWGLSSQSHYDAQGELPILVTRLEETANNGEIVLDGAVLDALGGAADVILAGRRLEERTLELKGIGPWTVRVIADGSAASS